MKDFSIKAQLAKSVASAIPPHPQVYLGVSYFLEAANTSSSIPSPIVRFVQLDLKNFVGVERSPKTKIPNLARQAASLDTGFVIVASS